MVRAAATVGQVTWTYGDDPTQPRPLEPDTQLEPHHPLEPYYPPVGGPPVARATNTMAILSLVFAFVFWPLAILFGHIGKRQITRTGEGGGGLATAGLVIGYLWLGLTVCVCCGGLLLLPNGTASR
ncbi:MAG: hypothetical protein QOE03_2665 [Micromonosporaceae bacterium]|jgi:hypothetical protein|nr:hypothetical protein [Micromonosporaceae bacterium]